jgi:hypothetical protein
MKKTEFFLFIVGFLMTFGGVGGVENSVTDAAFLGATAIACLGLAVMYCGVLMMKVRESY